MFSRIKTIDLREFAVCLFLILFKYIPICFFVKLFFKRRIWLISERRNDARDNGYWLFKYLRINHPEIPVFYAIDFNCNDYIKVKEFNNVVNWGSFRHYCLLSQAVIIASTDFGLGFPRTLMRPILMRFLSLRQKFVFLQHGIIKDDLTHAKKHKLRANLFICGAKPEYDFILNNFGYTSEELKYTGLARFDNLFDTSKTRQILYMPTWRNGLSDKFFSESVFYNTISHFLSSKGLKEYLTDKDIKLVFFLHPAFRDKKKYFNQFATDSILIANNDDYDLQELLKTSSLLITDYSSIYFDFAYMGKPVVYYQFDYEEYRNAQYKEGYFSYEKNGFGPVIKTESKLIEYVKEIADNKWENPKEYILRAEAFFPLHDNRNCERLYMEMLKLIN